MATTYDTDGQIIAANDDTITLDPVIVTASRIHDYTPLVIVGIAILWLINEDE